ncbi:MAG TPA: hypothetical protein VGW38_10810 [Chloroflexota bacterium]|nr:hypothetical protein [Chloroflexota bacterium]
MRTTARIVAAAALAMLAGQPCLAAEDMRAPGAPERRSATFAGASVRLPLDRPAKAKPSARLQLAMTHDYWGANGVPRAPVASGSALELGLGTKGKPALYMGGVEVKQAQQQLGVGGSTGTTVLIVGGIVLVVGALALLASRESKECRERDTSGFGNAFC